MRPQPLPAHRDRWAARRQRLLRGAKLGPQQRKPAGLSEPLGGAAIPTPTPRTAASARLLGVHQVQLAGPSAQRVANTAIAWRRSATCAANARIPNWYWSSTARVIAPAHRLDAAAVTERLHCPRHAACDSRSSRPRPARRANSVRYSEPRCVPIAVNAAASPSVT